MLSCESEKKFSKTFDRKRVPSITGLTGTVISLITTSAAFGIQETIATEGKTIILSSHNPNHALYLDANVFFLKNGKLMKEGLSSSIINKETLSDIYGNNVCYSKDLEYEEISFK